MKAEEIEDIYELSPIQNGMLFHCLYAAEKWMYVAQRSYLISGSLDTECLEQAWQATIDRHPALRTSFQWEDLDHPVQIVHRRVKLTLHQEDWREAPAIEQQERFRSRSESDRRRGFDSSRPPLARLFLARLGNQSYQLIWTYHMIQLDGWSLPVVIEDLLNAYEALCAGRPIANRRAGSFGNYIEWLSLQPSGDAERYWRGLLGDFTSRTQIPTVQTAREANNEQDCARRQVSLSEAATSALQSIARQRRLTISTLVQGAWAILLSRYSGEQDVVFGVTVSGRPAELEGAESAVGLFINTLPVRVRLKWEENSAALLARLQEQQVEMLRYQFSSLIDVQRWSGAHAGGSLFDSVVVFENYPVEFQKRTGRLAVSALMSVEHTSIPLTLLAGAGDRIWLRLVYHETRFDEATVTRMLNNLCCLLEELAEDPDRRLLDLRLLTREERTFLLAECNDTDETLGSVHCIHELFEMQAGRTPDATALVYEGEQVCYAELNGRANKLAGYLRKNGVGPDVLVGICVERSCEMVIGLLGILKAGGAYLPLEPSYPAERVKWMAESAGVRIVLTQEAIEDRLAGVSRQIICLDSEWQEIEKGSSESAAAGATPENLAYVIFTSGSTGVPKGVMISHRSICNRLLWMQSRYPHRETDKIVLKTSFSFDASGWEIFVPLFSGAQVVIARSRDHLDTGYLAGLIAAERATVLQLVPSMLRVLLEEQDLSGCESLKHLYCGGEALATQLRDLFYDRLDARLHNLYGPTEASIDITHWECENADSEFQSEQGLVPIGRPLSNTRIYLLDELMRLVPTGASGELYADGVGLARGYLNRPDLTADKFVPDPFSDREGARLYKTGDLAKRRPDGCIEYLGRRDHQLKIRGFRIEPGEIESVLRQLGGVNDAVVAPREDANGHKRLVAYVVTRSDESTDPAVLREQLSERLPAHMIPSAFVLLRSLPLSVNGKVDRSALPDFSLTSDKTGNQEESAGEPRNQIEATLVEIWAAVLGVDSVGIHDDFFQLGGDSILSIRIAARAKPFGLDLSPKQIFEYPTIAQLSAVVSVGRPRTVEEQGAVQGPVQLTPIQRRFFEQRLPNIDHFNQAVMLALKRPIEIGKMEASIRKVMEHHDALRLRFERETGGEWRQWNAGKEQSRVYAHVDLSNVDAEKREREIEKVSGEIQRSLELRGGPLVRMTSYQGGEDDWKMLMVAHHLAVDGVSWRILVEDIERGYEQLERGEEIRLGEKTMSYQRWSERLAEYGRSEEIKKEAEYWEREDEREVKPVRVGLEGDDNSAGSIGAVNRKVKEEQTRELLGRKGGGKEWRIEEVLVAVLGRSYERWSGEEKVRIDMEGHGREEIWKGIDVTRTVGWFTSIYPMVVEAKKEERGLETVKRVKEQMRRMEKKGVGYGVVRYLTERGRARTWRGADIVFNYLGQVGERREGGGLFEIARERKVGSVRDERGEREHLIEVSGLVKDNELELNWAYSRNKHRREHIERFADLYCEELLSLADADKPAPDTYLPSDFPNIDLSQADLDSIVAELELA